MAFSFNNGVSAAIGTSGTTGSINTTGVDVIVVLASNRSGGRPTLSDNQGNTWTNGPEAINATQADSYAWYCISPTTNAAHTFSISSGNQCAISVMTFTSSDPILFDNSSANNTGGSSIQPGSITPNVDGALLVTSEADVVSETTTINSGFTKVHEIEQGGGSDSVVSAYLVQGTAAAVNPTWQGSLLVGRTAVMMSFVEDPYVIVPSLIASSESVPSPSLDGSIAPSHIASGETFYTHLVDAGIGVPLIASGETFYTHTIAITGEIGVPLIASGETFYTHIVSWEVILIPLIASGESFPTHIVQPPIGPTNVASGESFPTHTVTVETFGATQLPLYIDLSTGEIRQMDAFDTGPTTATDNIINAGTGAAVKATPMYLTGTNNEADLAEVSDYGPATVIGLVNDASIAAGATGEVVTGGSFSATLTEWDAVTGETGGLVAGAVYYVGRSSAGTLTRDLSSFVSGEVVSRVGQAKNANVMVVERGPLVKL